MSDVPRELKTWSSTRIIHQRQPPYCPTCGMSRPLMRLIVIQAMGEGFVAGLAVGMFVLVLMLGGLPWAR